MSGQPYKHASDPMRFREDYMKALNMRADIDKMNLQANNVYKQTGQLPALSQLPDNRTTTEILGDVAKLKTELIGDLAPIASPQLAQMIIQRIEKHPLNVDGGFFTFIAQRMPDVVAQMKKVYKYKIKGDTNDADTLVQYLADYYNKAKSTLGGFKTFVNRPSSSVASMSLTDINNLINVFNELSLKIHRRYGKITNEWIDKISKRLLDIKRFLSLQEHQEIILGYRDDERGLDNAERVQLYNKFNEILESLPDEASILTLYDRLDRSIKNANPKLTEDILVTIYELIPEILPGILARMEALINNYGAGPGGEEEDEEPLNQRYRRRQGDDQIDEEERLNRNREEPDLNRQIRAPTRIADRRRRIQEE